MDTGKVTRFEVIDQTGRALTRYGVSVKVALQDDGRTLKVFLGDSPVSADKVEAQIRDGLAVEMTDAPPL